MYLAWPAIKYEKASLTPSRVKWNILSTTGLAVRFSTRESIAIRSSRLPPGCVYWWYLVESQGENANVIQGAIKSNVTTTTKKGRNIHTLPRPKQRGSMLCVWQSDSPVQVNPTHLNCAVHLLLWSQADRLSFGVWKIHTYICFVRQQERTETSFCTGGGAAGGYLGQVRRTTRLPKQRCLHLRYHLCQSERREIWGAYMSLEVQQWDVGEFRSLRAGRVNEYRARRW
jgi:hypothetical protein